MSDNDARLAMMANQIARNLATRGNEAAAQATAEHIALFWDPRMITGALALLERDAGAYAPAAAAALRLVATHRGEGAG